MSSARLAPRSPLFHYQLAHVANAAMTAANKGPTSHPESSLTCATTLGSTPALSVGRESSDDHMTPGPLTKHAGVCARFSRVSRSGSQVDPTPQRSAAAGSTHELRSRRPRRPARWGCNLLRGRELDQYTSPAGGVHGWRMGSTSISRRISSRRGTRLLRGRCST